MTGLGFENLQAGLMASLPGIVILHLPSTNFSERMFTILICAFGFMISFLIGLLFSFNPFISSLVFGLFALFVHWVCLYLKVRPPGSFFFIMLAAVSSCMPFNLSLIPLKLGLIGLGAINATTLAFLYSLMTLKTDKMSKAPALNPDKFEKFFEALILGVFMFASMLLGKMMKIENPYWIPISCAAVMQAGSTYTIWQRTFHRLLGTFIGIGLCWLILSFAQTPLALCLSIIALQFIIEMLVVRNYAFAVIFITPLTILLTEAGNPLIFKPELIIPARLDNIIIGSAIGALGGWAIYHEQLREFAIKIQNT